MKEHIDWMVNLEVVASRCYEKAAALFSEEKELAEFLGRMAEDEKNHFKIIIEATECIKEKKGSPSLVISFDEETRQKLELPLVEFEKAIDGGRLTKQTLFDYMVSAEFSEWNDIFLHILDSLKECHDFSRVAPGIQQHRRGVERFLEEEPGLKGLLEKIKQLPPAWQERILIVEDSKTRASLFASILKDEGGVERAANGTEALETLSGKYFAAVITDVEMPVMDGMEFYKRAVEKYPHMNERILFCTDNDDERYLNFFRKNRVRYIITPVPMKKLKNAVADILKRPAR